MFVKIALQCENATYSTPAHHGPLQHYAMPVTWVTDINRYIIHVYLRVWTTQTGSFSFGQSKHSNYSGDQKRILTMPHKPSTFLWQRFSGGATICIDLESGNKEDKGGWRQLYWEWLDMSEQDRMTIE